MTMFGHWTCPKCGNKWEGSIGNFHGYIFDDNNKMDERLEKICGCTRKKFTEEEFNETDSFSIIGKITKEVE